MPENTPPGESDAAVMVVTDCCGRLLPESQTLVGDVHITDMCPACDWLVHREGEQPEHDRHRTCDWSQGVECPGRDWTYDAETKRVIRPETPSAGGQS